MSGTRLWSVIIRKICSVYSKIINYALDPWEDFIDDCILDTNTWKVRIFVTDFALLF